MSENKKQEPQKINIKISGLDINKAEYEQIVLSNTNRPDKDYFKKEYYD